MKSRLARLGVLLAAVFGLLATMVPAASADTYKTITIVGQVNLPGCQGLGYPVVTNTAVPGLPTVKPGPKPGTTVANIPPQGNHCNFELVPAVCTKTSVGKKIAAVDTCGIIATGTVWGYCGYSTGQGNAVVDATTKEPISTTFKFTGVGGLLTVTGGNANKNIVGEIAALPTVGTCANKTATGFTVAGEVVYKDCNNGGTTAGVCNP